VIDFFAPPRAEFLLGGKPNYVSEDSQTSNLSSPNQLPFEFRESAQDAKQVPE
jgi:hypothetical protein